MDITSEAKREIIDYVCRQYFGDTRIERLVLEYLGEQSLAGNFTSGKDIGEHLERSGESTSAGAIRGTILRIRHKLLKYREETPQHTFHLTFPELASRRGYLLQFIANRHYRAADLAVQDPWLAMNWKVLREQGYRGLWRGLSLPDGGRWPVKLYVWINSVRDDKRGAERFMCLLNSPSSAKHRIGILEGEIKDNILCMEGKWCAHYPESGLEHFHLTARLWPFRTDASEPVRISGRFTLYQEKQHQYQEGRIELDYCPSPDLPDFIVT